MTEEKFHEHLKEDMERVAKKYGADITDMKLFSSDSGCDEFYCGANLRWEYYFVVEFDLCEKHFTTFSILAKNMSASQIRHLCCEWGTTRLAKILADYWKEQKAKGEQNDG